MSNIVKLVPDTLFELKDGLVKVLSKGNEMDRTQSFTDSKPLTSDNPRVSLPALLIYIYYNF